jgi:hypothetical protein
MRLSCLEHHPVALSVIACACESIRKRNTCQHGRSSLSLSLTLIAASRAIILQIMYFVLFGCHAWQHLPRRTTRHRKPRSPLGYKECYLIMAQNIFLYIFSPVVDGVKPSSRVRQVFGPYAQHIFEQ